jgi:hypothetical protein
MRKMVLGSALVLVASCLLGGCSSGPGNFPGEISGSKSDVSIDKAASDHGVLLPKDPIGLLYQAWKGGEGYPLDVSFSLECSQVPPFLAENHVRKVLEYYALPNSNVYSFAADRGWKPKASGIAANGMPLHTLDAQWFNRSEGGELEVLVDSQKSNCSIYLTASL